MPATMTVTRALLRTFSWQELRQHPWRNAAAVVAVTLGVALAFSVQLINASALDEFAGALRSVSGQPDLELRAVGGGFDEALFARIAKRPEVTLASPVLELQSFAQGSGGAGADPSHPPPSDIGAGIAGRPRLPLRVVGVDPLLVARVAPALMPMPFAGAAQDPRETLFAPDTLFLNPAARRAFGLGGASDETAPTAAATVDGRAGGGPRSEARLSLQSGLEMRPLRVAGTVQAGGAPLAVMDIAAAQEFFGRIGQLSRIDLRLAPGTDIAAFIGALALPPEVAAQRPADGALRVGNLSRAYRVNLTVLALVALFTGAFLVFSVLSLSVAKRSQQFALLAVLGLTGRERLRLVLWESLALGVVGSAAGIALGTLLAGAALRLLGGDLGGGYFAGVAPGLQWSGQAALVYGGLGVVAALAGGWWPARAAQALPPAQALKGLGGAPENQGLRRSSLLSIAAAGLLALAPPLAGIPWGAYLSVGLLLVGGIGALPWLIALLYDRLAPRVAHRLLPLLAVERARRVRESAAVAVSGVVASLALAIALTVMVASFRGSMLQWLDRVVPADLYLRTAPAAGAGDTVYLPLELARDLARVDGVERLATQRNRSLQLDPAQPPVQLLAREIGDPERSLPLVGPALPVPPGQVGVYVSEAMVDLYGARVGAPLQRLAPAFAGTAAVGVAAAAPRFFVAGIWRDYARQFGSIAMERSDFERLSGDTRINDIALWLKPGTDAARVQRDIRALAQARLPGSGELLEFASTGEIRATSMRIFDRSFAVTYWLQAVAIGIGLFGVAASFSAQVLARRKEFGLLTHLGLTRRQILAVVAGEGAAWTLIGSLAGLGLGLAVAVVLVEVVNPQSFHWSMDLLLPWGRLAALCGAVVAAGTLTAWLAGRAAAGRDAVLAVKEDW